MEQLTTEFLDHVAYAVPQAATMLADAPHRLSHSTYTSPEPALIHDIGPHADAPATWERDYFLVNDIPVYYYVSRAKNELGVIVGCSGLKADYSIKEDAVEAYNAAGISVIMMTLPNPGRSVGFMHFFEKVFRQFALNEDSPVNQLFPAELPKFLYGHSTGGQLATRMLTTASDAAIIAQRYVRAFIEAPFFDTANGSRHDPKYRNFAFNKYACLHRDELPRETFFGLGYFHFSNPDHRQQFTERLKINAEKIKDMPFKGLYLFATAMRTTRDLLLGLPFQQDIPEPYFAVREAFKASIRFASNTILNDSPDAEVPWYLKEDEYIIPTYGQILEDQFKGRKFVDDIKANKVSTAIPCTVIASPDDCFSCTKTTQIDIVPLLEADFYLATGEHDPLTQDKQARDYTLQQMEPHLLLTPLPEPVKEIQTESDSVFAIETEAPQPEERWSFRLLGHRFGSSLQRSASLLNPIARILQQFR